MSLESVIEENTAAIHALIAKLTEAGMSQQAAVSTTMHQVVQEAKKPAEPKKVKEPKPETKPEEKSAPVAKTVPYEEVKNLILKVSQEKGHDSAVALLQRLGVAKASQLLPSQYEEAIKLGQDALAGVDPSDSLL